MGLAAPCHPSILLAALLYTGLLAELGKGCIRPMSGQAGRRVCCAEQQNTFSSPSSYYDSSCVLVLKGICVREVRTDLESSLLLRRDFGSNRSRSNSSSPCTQIEGMPDCCLHTRTPSLFSPFLQPFSLRCPASLEISVAPYILVGLSIGSARCAIAAERLIFERSFILCRYFGFMVSHNTMRFCRFKALRLPARLLPPRSYYSGPFYPFCITLLRSGRSVCRA